MHKVISSENGFPGGPVYALAQTNDGYLWIGTEKGLVRFDGLHFRLFQHTDSSNAPFGPVLALTTDSQGALWVRLQGAGLLRYRDGRFDKPNLERPEAVVSAIARGTHGDLLLSGLRNGIGRFHDGRFERLSAIHSPSMPNFLVISMTQTDDGTIWLGTRDTGLFQFAHGQISPGPTSLRDRKINCLLAAQQELWIGTDTGLIGWDETGSTSSSPVPTSLQHAQILALARDRDSNIWVGTADGLFKIDVNGVLSSDTSDRLPFGTVAAILEDREGNIWSGGTTSLLQIRHGTFTTYYQADGLPSTGSGAIYAAPNGRLWFAGSEGGLYWLKGGKFSEVRDAALEKEIVYSISGGADGVWIGRQNGGLTHIPENLDWRAAKTYTQSSGLAQNSVYSVYEDRNGAIWAGTLSAGVSRFRDGHFTTFTTFDGLLSNTITSILQSPDGTMWFGTPRGVSSFSHDQWENYGAQPNAPLSEVNCLLVDSHDTLWIGTATGPASIHSRNLSIPVNLPEALREPVLGLAEDQQGYLWISTSNHVLHVNRQKLLDDSVQQSDIREFGIADGLQSTEGVKRSPSVLTDSSHRIWFSMNRGLSFVDPARQPTISPPAIVQIEQVSSDDLPLAMQGDVLIPAPHHRVKISYTGVSLSIPERVRFRYMLEGLDQNWSEPTDSREVTYNNLDSRSYTFRLIASNGDGLWNSAESHLNLQVQPLLWERWWFRLAIVAALAIAILLFFQLRLLRLSRQLNMRFDERLSERTRIARELHDTLLQGVISASMQLHVAAESLPENSPGRAKLNRVLELMAQVTEEGRNTVHGLRSSAEPPHDLEAAFSRIPQELGHPEGREFRVVVQGHTLPLRTPVREEVYGIIREAIVNAFRHSRANNIDVQLEYAPGQLRIIVGDDGCGIDPHVLQTGKEGHWGLSGMRERAKRIGAKLRVLSRPAAGTEVELTVPNQVAYVSEPAKGLSNWVKAVIFKGKKWSTDL